MTGTGNILVTGFGPFGEHKVNASWEAVRLLPDTINGLAIIKTQIPVVYDHVQKKVPILWNTLKPELVIHVGVSSLANVITIETSARSSGYERLDIYNECPKNSDQSCVSGTCLSTGLDVKTLCHRVNEMTRFSAVQSNDPGRYLCEYIYYQSLTIDKDKTLFIHVPPLNKPYSAEQLAEVLKEIIVYSMDMLHIGGQKACAAYPDKIYKNGRAAAAF